MLKYVLTAGLLLGASPALAKTYAYTFADNSGNPYCDGITLKGSDVLDGHHTGSCQSTPLPLAGGNLLKLKGTRDKIIYAVTSDSTNKVGSEEVFVLDTTALTWTLYFQSAPDGVKYRIVTTGTLLVGANTQARGPHPDVTVLAGARTH